MIVILFLILFFASLVFLIIGTIKDNAYIGLIKAITMLISLCFILFLVCKQPNIHKSRQYVEYKKCEKYVQIINDSTQALSILIFDEYKESINTMNEVIEESNKNDNWLLRDFYDPRTKALEPLKIGNVNCKLISQLPQPKGCGLQDL